MLLPSLAFVLVPRANLVWLRFRSPHDKVPAKTATLAVAAALRRLLRRSRFFLYYLFLRRSLLLRLWRLLHSVHFRQFAALKTIKARPQTGSVGEDRAA